MYPIVKHQIEQVFAVIFLVFVNEVRPLNVGNVLVILVEPLFFLDETQIICRQPIRQALI